MIVMIEQEEEDFLVNSNKAEYTHFVLSRTYPRSYPPRSLPQFLQLLLVLSNVDTAGPQTNSWELVLFIFTPNLHHDFLCQISYNDVEHQAAELNCDVIVRMLK